MDKKILFLSVLGLCILGLLCFGVFTIIGDTASDGAMQEPSALVHALPEGYTLDSYTVEEITNVFCTQDADCLTPAAYAIQSRCPFTALCLKNKCTVVCPDYEN